MPHSIPQSACDKWRYTAAALPPCRLRAMLPAWASKKFKGWNHRALMMIQFFFASKFALFATFFHFFATPPYVFATPPYIFATPPYTFATPPLYFRHTPLFPTHPYIHNSSKNTHAHLCTRGFPSIVIRCVRHSSPCHLHDVRKE